MRTDDPHLAHAVLAGVVCALVGYTSSFAVALAGLRAVGATAEQAGSGLLVLSLTMGVGCILFSLARRQPITMAWSTPGAAMLATAAVPAGGFGAAVGAFIVAGALLALTGVVGPLGRLMGRVPPQLASAMLAGVLLPLCLAPVRSLAEDPRSIAPVVLAWLVGRAVAPRWAVPAAVATAGAVIVAHGGIDAATLMWPDAVPVAPRLEPAAVLALALPLYLVTMTSQNLPGVAVLAGFGYRVDPRGPLLYTGAATMAGAVLGGHAINLAAISAALAAGPEAHPDRDRRWIAGVACGVTYVLFGLGSGIVIGVADAAPAGLLASVAGLALLATFGGAASTALTDPDWREPAAVALVVGASGLAVWGIGAAFWALVAGGVLAAGTRRRRRSTARHRAG